MFDNDLQHYWKVVVEKLYHVVPWLGGRMYFAVGEVCFIIRQAITAEVEQSVRRLVQQDAVDDIRRLPDVWMRVLHVRGDYF